MTNEIRALVLREAYFDFVDEFLGLTGAESKEANEIHKIIWEAIDKEEASSADVLELLSSEKHRLTQAAVNSKSQSTEKAEVEHMELKHYATLVKEKSEVPRPVTTSVAPMVFLALQRKARAEGITVASYMRALIHRELEAK